MQQSPAALLSFIRGAETRLGYDDISNYAKTVHPTTKRPSEMTVGEVREWQREAIRKGAESTAFGGYQIISSTFDEVVNELGLPDSTVMSPEVQDLMGTHLLRRRGFDDWNSGAISDEQFIENLSLEWAGLPGLNGASAYEGTLNNAATRSVDQLRLALNATRNGEELDLSNLPADAQWMPSGTPSAAPDEATLANYNQNFATSRPVFTSFADEQAAERQANASLAVPEEPTFGQAVSAAFGEENSLAYAIRQAGGPDNLIDYNWRLTPEVYKELSEGLPEEYAEAYLSEALSLQHAKALRDAALADMARDQTLANYGFWPGMGLRVGAAMLDPIGIAAGALTGGVGAGALRANRVRRFLMSGAAGGSANAVVDGYIASQDPTRGTEDVLFSAMAGFVMGGAIGAIPRTQVDRELAQVFAQGLEEVTSGVPRGTAAVGAQVADGAFPERLTPAKWAAQVTENAPRTAYANMRYDVSAALKRSKSSVVRFLGGELVEDAVGNADGSAVAFSASERISMETTRRLARLYRKAEPAYHAWAREQGLSTMIATTRSQFFEQVGKAIRRPLDAEGNAHVNKVAAAMKAEYADLLQYAKDSGLRGFDEIEENLNYLTRQYNLKRIEELDATYGAGTVNQLVARSLVENSRKRTFNGKEMGELDYEDALKVASGLLGSVRSRKHGAFDMNLALTGNQEDTLRAMLTDAGIDDPSIDRIVSTVRGTSPSEEAGRIGSAKRRLGLDETYSMKVYDRKTGTEATLSIEDLLENDAEALFTSYSRSLIGNAEVSKVFRKLQMPAEDGATQPAVTWSTIKSYALENGANQTDIARLETIVNVLTARPVEPEARWKELGRVARDFNFIRLMGQVGFAQIAEVGNTLGHVGWRAALQQMPLLRRLYANAQTGEFSSELLKEIEFYTGFGTDLVRHSPTIRPDDFGLREDVGLNNPVLRQADYTLQQAKRLTSVTSGMAHITMGLQRFAASAIAQKFVNFADTGSGIGMRRLRALGLDDADIALITPELRSKPSRVDGPFGRRVKSLNLDQWDPTARAVFTQALYRYSRRVVQENDIGNLPLLMTKEGGKLIFQFRSFMLAAYSKQLLGNVRAWDSATAAAFSLSIVFGGLSYIGQTHLRSFGQEDRQAYLEERLSPMEIGKAAFQRAGFSSLVPATIDTATSMSGLDPVFTARTTGVGTSLFDNPTLSVSGDSGLINGTLATGARALRAATSDYEFTAEDYRRFSTLTPFSRALGIANAHKAIEQAFPSQYDQAQ